MRASALGSPKSSRRRCFRSPTRSRRSCSGGGKRLRPAFAYWGYRGAGGVDSDQVVTAVAALELVQASALIHDDVMDALGHPTG